MIALQMTWRDSNQMKSLQLEEQELCRKGLLPGYLLKNEREFSLMSDPAYIYSIPR